LEERKKREVKNGRRKKKTQLLDGGPFAEIIGGEERNGRSEKGKKRPRRALPIPLDEPVRREKKKSPEKEGGRERSNNKQRRIRNYIY